MAFFFEISLFPVYQESGWDLEEFSALYNELRRSALYNELCHSRSFVGDVQWITSAMYNELRRMRQCLKFAPGVWCGLSTNLGGGEEERQRERGKDN